MIPYSAPLADMRFVLNNLVGLEKLAAMGGYDAVNAELVDAILDEAGKLSGGVFAPLNHSGDREGAKFDNEKVTTPKGFREAYQAFVDGGWNGLPVAEALGGQGLPWTVAMPVQEMWQSSNMALALATLLNQGAIELLGAHASDALKSLYLPKLVSGEWAGTMNITEPQAGSDVGAIRCNAKRDGERYLITGQKIFISYGEHDLTQNIVHLVLARLPDAPEGTRGLTLFLVPKILVNPDGSLGKPNDLRAVSMEHKLGQHAGPTCVMAFGDNGGAEGYLVGEEHGGIAAMFVMMNNARIGVGVQGLGAMERSYQQARDYAAARVQSRDIATPKAPPVPIVRHPDVKRMLMFMRSVTEAGRALAYSCAFAMDALGHGCDDSQKKWGATRADFLTPIVKAWLTDMANEVTSIGVQICGGMGYIEETGMAQHMRDARVLSIYEGTNGIQANDLVFRKLVKDGGNAFREMLVEVDACLIELSKLGSVDGFAAMQRHLADSSTALRSSADWMLKNAPANPSLAAAGATPFLRLAGNTLGGYYLIKSAMIAQKILASGTAGGDADFLKAKIATAGFFAANVLPISTGLATMVMEGAATTMAFE